MIDPEGTSGIGEEFYLVRDFEHENDQVRLSSRKNVLERGKEAKAPIKETMTGVFSELGREKWRKKNCSRTGGKNKRESERNVN